MRPWKKVLEAKRQQSIESTANSSGVPAASLLASQQKPCICLYCNADLDLCRVLPTVDVVAKEVVIVDQKPARRACDEVAALCESPRSPRLCRGCSTVCTAPYVFCPVVAGVDIVSDDVVDFSFSESSRS